MNPILKDFLKFALKEYEASYSTGEFSGTQVSEARILYLAGRNLKKDRQRKGTHQVFFIRVRKTKKCPGSLHHPDGQGPLSGTQTDPGNTPLCCGTDKKRAVPSRNSLLSAVDD
ncbi:DUF2225 domain-containing protein [Peribacillus frigoritolerans]|uniref:DUF2225 domain-containing protein n=1 Tax=Peribacillus frigoritolerans TaxID=450367 RepID=UPI00382813B6